jgi:hypothetical protein
MPKYLPYRKGKCFENRHPMYADAQILSPHYNKYAEKNGININVLDSSYNLIIDENKDLEITNSYYRESHSHYFDTLLDLSFSSKKILLIMVNLLNEKEGDHVFLMSFHTVTSVYDANKYSLYVDLYTQYDLNSIDKRIIPKLKKYIRDNVDKNVDVVCTDIIQLLHLQNKSLQECDEDPIFGGYCVGWYYWLINNVFLNKDNVNAIIEANYDNRLWKSKCKMRNVLNNAYSIINLSSKEKQKIIIDFWNDLREQLSNK